MKYKNYLIALLSLVFVVGVSFIGKRQAKTYSLTGLTEQDVVNIYNSVDNAVMAGEVRKPLLQKISVQFNQQMQPPAPVSDSSKSKKQKP